VLCRVSCGGEILEQDDKLVCTRRTYMSVVDATDMLRHFSRLCALDVIQLWAAPEVIRRYLRTGDDKLQAAAASAARDDGADWANWAARAAWAASVSWPNGNVASAARIAAGAAAGAWAAAAGAVWRWEMQKNRQNRRLHRMAMKLIRAQTQKNGC
jgi:hypothetical protein